MPWCDCTFLESNLQLPLSSSNASVPPLVARLIDLSDSSWSSCFGTRMNVDLSFALVFFAVSRKTYIVVESLLFSESHFNEPRLGFPNDDPLAFLWIHAP